MPKGRDLPKGNLRAPILIVCLIVLLAAACIGATYLGKEAEEEEPLISSYSQAEDAVAPVALEMEESAVPEFADDVVMTLNGSKDTIVLAGEDYIESGCHVIMEDGTDLTDSVEVSGEVDAAVPGDYAITYTVNTPDGRYASTTREVHVVDDMDVASDLPVLMYHYIYTDMDQPDVLDANYLLDTDFERQLQYLNGEGFYYPSMQEVRAFVDGKHSLPANSVVPTFDDGEPGFLDYGIPLLNEYEVPATSYLICSDEDAAYKAQAYASEYVRFQSHSYDMHRAGSDVGQGGRIHAMTEQQILEDAEAAEAILGDVQSMAYPFGDNNEAAWAALEDAGVLCAFTVKNARIAPGDNPYALNRVRISGGYTLDGFASLVS